MPKRQSDIAVVYRLLASAKPIWDRFSDHPFVKGIEDGSLDKEKFRYYILQDYRYLEEYAKENVTLMAHLNRLTENYTEQQVRHLIDIFIACSRYEEKFWDFSWNMER